MNDRFIEDLISAHVHPTPDAIWDKVKRDIAITIASNLLTTLDRFNEPRKQENLDRVDSMIIAMIPQQLLLKGA